MKKMIWTFIASNLGAILFLFIPDGMLLTDSSDGVNVSNFLFLSIVHAIPNIIAWLINRKKKSVFVVFLIFQILSLFYVLLIFITVGSDI